MEWKKAFRKASIERGDRLVRQGKVRSLSLESYEATFQVEESKGKTYEVTVKGTLKKDPMMVGFLRCSCGERDCEHLAASLFQLSLQRKIELASFLKANEEKEPEEEKKPEEKKEREEKKKLEEKKEPEEEKKPKEKKEPEEEKKPVEKKEPEEKEGAAKETGKEGIKGARAPREEREEAGARGKENPEERQEASKGEVALSDSYESLAALELARREELKKEGTQERKICQYFKGELILKNVHDQSDFALAKELENTGALLLPEEVRVSYQVSRDAGAEQVAFFRQRVQMPESEEKVMVSLRVGATSLYQASCSCSFCTRPWNETISGGNWRLCGHTLASLRYFIRYAQEKNLGDYTSFEGRTLMQDDFWRETDLANQKLVLEGSYYLMPTGQLVMGFFYQAEGNRKMPLFCPGDFVEMLTKGEESKAIPQGLKGMRMKNLSEESQGLFRILASATDGIPAKRGKIRRVGKKNLDAHEFLLSPYELDLFYFMHENAKVQITMEAAEGKSQVADVLFTQVAHPLTIHVDSWVTTEGEYAGILVGAQGAMLLEGKMYAYCLTKRDEIWCLCRLGKRWQERLSLLNWKGCDFPPVRLGIHNAESFFKKVLPKLETIARVEIHESASFLGCTSPSFTLSFALIGRRVVCSPMAEYGGYSYHIVEWEDKKSVIPSREKRKEQKERSMLNQVERYLPSVDIPHRVCYGELKEDGIYALFTTGLHTLSQMATVRMSPAFAQVKIRKMGKVRLVISMEEELCLSLQAENASSQEMAYILARYQEQKKFTPLRNGDLLEHEKEPVLEKLLWAFGQLQISPSSFTEGKMVIPFQTLLWLEKNMGEHVEIEKEPSVLLAQDYFEKEGAMFCPRSRRGEATKQASGPDQSSKNFVFRGEEPSVSYGLAEEQELERSWEENKKETSGNHVQEAPLPASLRYHLTAYQRKGYDWLASLDAHGYGGIFSDEAGLGKIPVIAAALLRQKEREEAGLSLVVGPEALLYQWEEELHRMAPSLEVMVVLGSAEQRLQMISHCKGKEVLLTSFEMLKKDMDAYTQYAYHFLIVDGAAYVRNSMAKCLKELKAKTRVVLTGAYMENRLSELWTLFDIVMPGLLLERQKFVNEYVFPISKGMSNAQAQREALHRIIAPYILRRRKEAVREQIPSKLEKYVMVGFGEKQQSLYEALVANLMMNVRSAHFKDYAKSRPEVKEKVMRLRSFCVEPSLVYENYNKGSAKREACLELIRALTYAGSRVVVYSGFNRMLGMLETNLEEEKISCYPLYVSENEKKEREKKGACPPEKALVFFDFLEEGKENVVPAGVDAIIYLDSWWKKEVESQNEKVLTVYKLLCKNTIEEKVRELTGVKREFMENLLSGEETSQRISSEVLMEILER